MRPLSASIARVTLPLPLHVRLRKDHYPHDERSPRPDDHVVLSGGLEVGGFHRSGSGPSEGRWSWAHAIGTDDTTLPRADTRPTRSMPHADHLGVPPDTRARRSARATERKARTTEPRAAGRDGLAFAADAGIRSRDRSVARDGSQRTARLVHSGELIVGVLNRPHTGRTVGRGSDRHSRPHDIGRGTPTREDAAFDDFASCWKRWLDWAGLEQVVPLQRTPNYDRRLAALIEQAGA